MLEAILAHLAELFLGPFLGIRLHLAALLAARPHPVLGLVIVMFEREVEGMLGTEVMELSRQQLTRLFWSQQQFTRRLQEGQVM